MWECLGSSSAADGAVLESLSLRAICLKTVLNQIEPGNFWARRTVRPTSNFTKEGTGTFKH